MLKTCQYCGKQFQGAKKQKYCSISCGLHKVPTKQLTCINCGSKFMFKGRTKRLRCQACHKKNRSMAVMLSRKKQIPTTQLGVGSGRACQHPVDTAEKNEHKQAQLKQRRQHYKQQKELGKYSHGYRKLVITGQDSCYLCGYNKHQESLVVHHKDMNRTNNISQNLVILCCNCHQYIHAVIRQKLKQNPKFSGKDCVQQLQLLKEV